MKLNKNIVLVGMMGSGKSTIGSLLSIKLGAKYLDVDKILENEEGTKISEIFEKKGEKYFRKLEEKISISLLKSKRNIISLGGGGFLNDKVRIEILNNHFSFWLNWNSSTIINRIKKSKKRPVTLHLNENEIKKLIIERSKIYSLANFKINCENLSKNEIIKKIIDIYEKK